MNNNTNHDIWEGSASSTSQNLGVTSTTQSKFSTNFDFKKFLFHLEQKITVIDFASIKSLLDSVFSKSSEDLTEYGLALISMIYRIHRSENLTDFFFIALDFLKATLGVSHIMKASKHIYEFLVSHVTKVYNSILVSSCFHAESKALDYLSSFKHSFSGVLESELVTSIRDFVLALVSFKLFKKDTAKNIQTVFGPAKSCNGTELVEVVLNAAVNICKCGDRLNKGESFSEILNSSDPVAEFMTQANEIETLQTLTYSGLPVDGKVCRREFLADLIKIIQSGDAILINLPRLSSQRLTVDRMLKKLKLLKAQFTNMMSAESRPMPFCVCATGLPGIGKGLLVDYFGMVWSQVKGRVYDQTHMYHRQATEEYWSGYEPLSKPIIHYSEPGSLHRSIAASRGDPVMTEFLSVADNQPYMCNMADLESKGKVYALPEFLVMDCNDPSMNLPVLVNNPAAIRRRILYILPTVKPEFIKKGTCRIDQAKSLASETPKLDRWTFTVKREEPENLIESNTVVLLRDGDIYELTALLKDLFTEHILQQEQRVNILKDEDIGNYFPESESAFVGPQLEGEYHRDSDFEFYSYRAIMIALEITWLFLFWSVHLIKLLTYYSMFTFAWFAPQNIFLKVCSLKALHSRIVYQRTVLGYWYGLLRSSVGFKNYCPATPATSHNYMLYTTMFAGVLVIFKAARSLTALSEGALLTTAKKRDESEVDEKLKEIQSNTALPPPRKRNGNGIDWDSSVRPKPVLITEQKQFNEPSQLLNTIRTNVRKCHIHGKKVFETRVCGLFSDYAIVNRHSLAHPKDDDSWEFCVWVDNTDQLGLQRVIITDSELTQIEGDLFLVKLRGLKFRDIRSLFAVEHVPPTAILGSVAYIREDKVIAKRSSQITVKDAEWGDILVSNPLTYEWSNHCVGMCGSPVLMEHSGGRSLVAIHIAGTSGDRAYAQLVNLQQITTAHQTLSSTSATLDVNSEGHLRLPENYNGLVAVPDRSPLRFEPCSGLSVYGGLKDYPQTRVGKSKLQSTCFIHHAEELTGVKPFDSDGRPLFAPPNFKHAIFEGEYVAPYNHFVKKAGVVKKSLDPRIMDVTIKALTKHIVTSLEARGVTELKPVPLDVAQNGFPEDFYMRAMKPSTSGGFPWPGAKSKYSDQLELSFKKDSYMPNKDVREQVLEQLEAYKRQEDAMPLLGAQLKDEPRAYAKVRAAKTRVFCMSPYESTLVNRMYLMPFYTLMVEFSEVFFTAIGINMHSTDVDDLIARLSKFFKFMEGDYGGFDTSMPYDIGLGANTVIYNVLKHFGYDEDALLIVQGILSDNMYPMIVMLGAIFAAPALQPSGKYATAEDNSLRGLIMLLYAWVATCTREGRNCSLNLTQEFEVDEFFLYVLAIIYGDDLVAGVSLRAQPFFNNNIYQTFCREIYGLDYTNALKTKEMKDFLERDEISFLKRTFRFDQDLGHWVAPLDRASIMKSICYVLPSTNVTQSEQLVDSCVSALRELFFHTPRGEYDNLRKRFAIRCCDAFGYAIPDLLKRFPSYEEIAHGLYPNDMIKAESCEVLSFDEQIALLVKMQKERKAKKNYKVIEIKKQREPTLGDKILAKKNFLISFLLCNALSYLQHNVVPITNLDFCCVIIIFVVSHAFVHFEVPYMLEFVGPFIEEFCMTFMELPMWFPLYEYCYLAPVFGYKIRVIPWIMHSCMRFLPSFQARFLCHALYNTCIVLYDAKTRRS